jgi:PKD repeat protein
VPGVVSPVLSVNKNNFCYNGSKALFQVNAVSNSSYKWFLNNQLIVGSNSSSYFADSTGNYKVLVSNTGCADTSNSIFLVVHPKPKANFTCVDTACISEIFNFIVITNNSTVSQGTINSNWMYSDGTTENTPNPVKVVNNSNNLNIKLIITSNNSCTDSISKTVVLKQKPIANFVINDSTQCLKNNYFSFTSSTQNGTFYSWDLGNNDISNITNPTKIFADTGNYLIKLKVESNNSCIDSITKSVTVSPNTIANFNFDTTVQCLKTNNFQFINSSKNFNNQIWYFGDTTNSTILNPTKKFSNPGTFIVKLVAKNGASCADSIYKTVTVQPNPNVGNINGNVTPTSISSLFSYSVSNQNNIRYNWAVTNGVIQNGQGTNSINVIWPTVGNGKVKLKVFNVYDCADSTELNTSITSVGIDEFNLNNSLMVYPNPTKNTIVITSKLNLTNKQFTISNIVGQIVLSGKLNNNETMLNLADLPNGFYLLNMEGSLDKSIKIIKE